MNPGPPAVWTFLVNVPQAGILDQSSGNTPRIQGNPVTRRRPQTIPYTHRHREQIQKTIELAKAEGKAETTLSNFYHRLNQLDRYADLMNPAEVKTAIAYAKLSNSSKSGFVFAYEWFTRANGLAWEKPRYKWSLPTPIIPTTENVNRIIAATSKHYATVFTLLAETGAEGEELHRTHRNQIDTQQGIISIKGTKGHASASYKLKSQTVEMLREYLARNPQDYPFPKAHRTGEIWRDTRDRLADSLKQPDLRKIPLKSLRNYSGAQYYYKTNDPIGVMRHLRHKKLETTMHYLRALVLNGDEEYISKSAKTPEEAKQLIELGYTYVQTIDNVHLYRKRK